MAVSKLLVPWGAAVFAATPFSLSADVSAPTSPFIVLSISKTRTVTPPRKTLAVSSVTLTSGTNRVLLRACRSS